MTCPKCALEQHDGATECSRCGIVFEKYKSHRQAAASLKPEPAPDGSLSDKQNKTGHLRQLLFHIDPEQDLAYIIGRAIVLFVLFAWGLRLIYSSIDSNYVGESFMHNINLPFHEAGHLLFRIFGQFMATMGGSLMQLLVPLVCLLTFLVRTRDPFAASVGLWWLGESLLDLAPYINDARELKLILLGGVTGRDVADYHDWEYILRNMGLLQYDHAIAAIAHFVGAFMMVCAFAWGGFILIKQLKSINAGHS